MLKKIIQNKKAQQTAEYALLISLVVAAVIAMQTYAQRTIQARIRDASQYLATETSALGRTNQYEPYYLDSSYTVVRNDETTELQSKDADGGIVELDSVSNRIRKAGGQQTSSYQTAFGLLNKL